MPEAKFTITYETREKSEQFLNNIDLSLKEDNIDFWFMCQAYEAIRDWFNAQGNISSFLEISSYFEIEDRINEMSARASHLEYDMKNEILTLSSQVSFSKINEDDVIVGSSERLSYDREREMLILSGSCRVIYDGDEYRAEQITIDMESDSISLNTSIRGQING